MGVFSRIERRLEHGVGSAFARMFKGKVHPAEIARALQQDADDNATRVAKGRTLVPNRYTVRLGDTDYDHLSEWERQLTRSLGEICREHFTNEGYSTYGAVKVSFERDDALRTGVFEIESAVDDAEPSVPLRDYLDRPAGNSRSAPSAGLRSTQSAAPRPVPPVPPADVPIPAPAFGGLPPANPAPPASTAIPGQTANPAHPGRTPYAADDHRPSARGNQVQAYRHLVVVDGTNDRLTLHEGRNVIGRGSTADVRISDTGISREHAEISAKGVLATISDLHSTNGTLVNGKRITRAALRHGDVIRVGRSVLVYRYEPEAAR